MTEEFPDEFRVQIDAAKKLLIDNLMSLNAPRSVGCIAMMEVVLSVVNETDDTLAIISIQDVMCQVMQRSNARLMQLGEKTRFLIEQLREEMIKLDAKLNPEKYREQPTP